MSELDPSAFKFDRYINGVLMAEGVTIERERDLPSVMRRAATLASRGPNGEVPVLVLRSTVSPLSDGDGWQPSDAEPPDVHGHMSRVSEMVTYFTDVLTRFGDSCVYVRRGGVSWGAVALNRRDDDKKNGVFDLQAEHDRDMAVRLGQAQRLIEDRNRYRDELWALQKSTAARSDVSDPCDMARELLAAREALSARVEQVCPGAGEVQRERPCGNLLLPERAQGQSNTIATLSATPPTVNSGDKTR